jgi:hypothetical protein
MSAQATLTEFTGSIGFMNPCNGEIVVGTGPVKIIYAANDAGQITIHSTFRVHAEGDQGNQYVMSFVSNANVDAPSGIGPGYVYFDSPVHGQVVAQGSAPNFAWDIYSRIFVANGMAVGSMFIGPSTTTCQGV